MVSEALEDGCVQRCTGIASLELGPAVGVRGDRFLSAVDPVAQVGLARMRRAVPNMQHDASPQYLAMADQGDAVTAAKFLAGLDDIGTLRSEVSQAFANWDLIMTPACAAMPWAAEKPFPEEIDGKAVGPRGHAIYTGWVNACGHPAIALPSDPAPNGLPIGFQLIGDLATEDLLLQTAAAYEESWPGDASWPAIACSDD